MPGNFTPDQTGYSRVFLTEGRARRDHKPSYESCTMAGALSKSFGDIEKIECPDPDRYNDFIQMGEVQASDDRGTMTLTSRYAADLASKMMEIASRRCPNDLQVHIGKCTDPSHFDTFLKALVLESARVTSYDIEDLGALASGDRNPVNESIDISMEEFYEILQLSAQEVGGDIVTNELIDGVICSTISCGDDCSDEDFGCEKIYFVSLAAGGSPGTPADVVYSIDKGATWYAHDVDTLGAAEDPTGIACVGIYIVVVSNDSNSLHYAEQADVVPTVDPAFTEQGNGFVVGGEPNDIWSVGNYAFIVGDGGYVYGTDDPTGGVAVLDAGVATGLQLNAVHAMNSEFAVAVGNSGAIIKTENQETWSIVTPINVLFTQSFQCVWVKSETEWWIGGATVGGVGQIWYTLDGGVTFYQVGNDDLPGLPGTYTQIYDLQFASDSVMYVTGTVAGPAGRILRSYNGGYSFLVIPEGTAVMPANDRITAIASCTDDVNFVVGGGLADLTADGFLVVAED